MNNRIKANARFVYKSKTSAEWQSENPILLNGEIGFVSDADEIDFFKIGDGTTPWNNLMYKRGAKGEQGEKGEQGIKGDTGEKGGYYVPSIENGVVSFVPSKEEMPQVDSVDLKENFATGEALEEINDKISNCITADDVIPIYNMASYANDKLAQKMDYDEAIQHLASIDTKAENAGTAAGTACVNAEEAKSIAKGRATGYVFDTVAELDAWLENTVNTEMLVQGDNFYIRAVDVPDYWWDGTQKQPLETQKVDLTEYVKETDYATSQKEGIVKIPLGYEGGLLKITTKQDGQIAVARATNIIIDARTPNDYIDGGSLGNNSCRPICPANLDYAVKKALADCKLTNTDLEWTENEKANARELLGITQIITSLQNRIAELENRL